MMRHTEDTSPHLCQKKGCSNKYYSSGWCRKHYNLIIRKDEILKEEKVKERLAKRRLRRRERRVKKILNGIKLFYKLTRVSYE